MQESGHVTVVVVSVNPGSDSVLPQTAACLLALEPSFVIQHDGCSAARRRRADPSALA